MAAVPGASQRRVCKCLRVSRARFLGKRDAEEPPKAELNEALAVAVRRLVVEYPTFGLELPL
jgi:hypothetical protein